MYIYMIVPVQYTKYHIWTRDPASSSLGEQYGEAIERARSIAVREPEAARQLRERMEQDRRDFLDDWLRLCLFGLAGPLLLLLRVWRRGWRGWVWWEEAGA